MIYAIEALRQIADLQGHYERKGRYEATRNLSAALIEAEASIQQRPEAGLPSPRPYTDLVRPGRLWAKAGRYWITYSLNPPTILGVFYEASDIQGRV